MMAMGVVQVASPALNDSRLGASAILAGRSFHSGIVRGQKEYLYSWNGLGKYGQRFVIHSSKSAINSIEICIVISTNQHQLGEWSSITMILVPYFPPRVLTSASADRLCVPDCHYAETRKRAFSIRGPSEWNALPLSIKSCINVNIFKRSLKTHLFRLAYP